MKNDEKVLVTGGTGAVGINCILQLLHKGYQVRTTLRSLDKKVEVIDMLANGGRHAIDDLEFIEADLTNDANWNKAVEGCTYVLHVASPTHITSTDEHAVVGPAVAGVLRVLKVSRDAGVKRVVLTSSFGALGFSNHDPATQTTEANWTDPQEKGLSVYERSKVLAERAAWEFIEEQGNGLELSVINPVAIYGPSLGPSRSPSLELIKMLLNGTMKATPNIVLNVVDIRDVADLHIRAMEIPAAAGERFIASADGAISMPQMAQLLKDHFAAIATKVPLRQIPNWMIYTLAIFSGQAKQAALLLKVNRNVSNAKARDMLGWSPIANNEEAILAAVESMIKFGTLQ